MFNNNNNNISNNTNIAVPAQNQPLYARYSVSHTDIPPPDPEFNQFTRGFSIFNNNMIFESNQNNSILYQNQQNLPALNQDTPVFNSKYRLSSVSSIPSSTTTTTTATTQNYPSNIINTTTSDNNINSNDIYLNNNQNNIVFNSNIFNSSQSTANNDTNTGKNNNHNNDNILDADNNPELFNTYLNTLLDNFLDTGSNLNFVKPKRKSSILFMDPTNMKTFDWNDSTLIDNNNNLTTMTNNAESSSIIPTDLDSHKILADSHSTANVNEIDPLCTQVIDPNELNPYDSFPTFNSNDNNNIIVEKSRSNSYNKKNSSLHNLLFGDKMTIPIDNSESVQTYLENNNIVTNNNLNILSPTNDLTISNKRNSSNQSNKNKRKTVKTVRKGNDEEKMLLKENKNNTNTPLYDRSETPLGETRIDQLMLMLQARQKGVTDEIKTDKDGELLLDQNPNVVPDRKVLAGGITKRKERDISNLSPIQKNLILSSPISRNQSDSESVVGGLLKSDSGLATNSNKDKSSIYLKENIDPIKIKSKVTTSPNTSNENKLNVTGLSNFFNVDELSSEEKQMIERNICPFCQHVFKQSTLLQVHLRSHLGYKPFKCKFCEKRFTQGGNLKTHEKLHTGLRPYECDICKRKFSRKGNLKAHMLTHNDTKPYICKLDNCNKSFTQLGNMKAHQNRFHKDTVLHLSNILAKWNPQTDDISEQDRHLLEYFSSLYKNSNKGIKGRGKGNANIKLIPGLDQDNNSLPTDTKEDFSSLYNNITSNSTPTAATTNNSFNDQVSPLQPITRNSGPNNAGDSNISHTYTNNTLNYTTIPKSNNIFSTVNANPININPQTSYASIFSPMMVSKFRNLKTNMKINNNNSSNNNNTDGIDINTVYHQPVDKENITRKMVKRSTVFPDDFLSANSNNDNNMENMKNDSNKTIFVIGTNNISMVPNSNNDTSIQKRKKDTIGRSNTNKRPKKKNGLSENC